MDTDEAVKRAKALAGKFAQKLTDPRYVKVMGLLVGKRLLYGNIKPTPSIKISIEDAIWVGRNIEARVLEVLPATLLHFPRAFLRKNNMPEELKRVLDHLRHNPYAKEGPDLYGISFKLYSRWTREYVGDKRVKPLDQKKIMKTYRLSPSILAKLSKGAKQKGLNETEYLEQIVDAAAI